MERALIIEPQALFAPFLSGLLADRGVAVVATPVALDADELTLARPGIVIVDASHVPQPLPAIAALRAMLPAARIAVLHRTAEPAWAMLARAFGADAILGADADERRLAVALGLSAQP